MNRLARPVLWIGLGVAIGVGAMLTNEGLLAQQQAPSVAAQAQATDPSFVLKIVAPGGTTSVECVSGCTFRYVQVATDGTRRTSDIPSFTQGCPNATCEINASGVIPR